MIKRALWLCIWGAAFGYMEAAVVVYLREIYYPEGFAFPLRLASGPVMRTEIGREAATLAIMAATAVLAFRPLQSRVAAFSVIFGVWDIFYYVFLKLLLGWPQSLSAWDILFLIPAPWAGPVWAPVLVSAGMTAAGIAVLTRRGERLPFGKGFVLAETAAGAIIVAAFLLSGSGIVHAGMPEPFAWGVFLCGFLLGAGAFLQAYMRTSGKPEA